MTRLVVAGLSDAASGFPEPEQATRPVTAIHAIILSSMIVVKAAEHVFELRIR
jgi:hypothetical protein